MVTIETFSHHCGRLSISIAVLMMYGYAPESVDDYVICAADEAVKLMGSLFGVGGTLINVMPFLRHVPSWVPGASGKKQAERIRWLTDEVRRVTLENASVALVSEWIFFF